MLVAHSQVCWSSVGIAGFGLCWAGSWCWVMLPGFDEARRGEAAAGVSEVVCKPEDIQPRV